MTVQSTQTRQELHDRLTAIEGLLGNVSLAGMEAETQRRLMTAWWESRVDVPRDDDLRALSLAEYERPDESKVRAIRA